MEQKELKALRRYHDLTQEKMASYLNISLKTYISRERGNTEFKLHEIYKITKLFNRPFNDIFICE